MPADHPTPEELERFLLNRPDPLPTVSTAAPPGTPSPAPSAVSGHKREIALHLLAGCAACFRRLRALGWDDERLDRLLIVPYSQTDPESVEAEAEGVERESGGGTAA